MHRVAGFSGARHSHDFTVMFLGHFSLLLHTALSRGGFGAGIFFFFPQQGCVVPSLARLMLPGYFNSPFLGDFWWGEADTEEQLLSCRTAGHPAPLLDDGPEQQPPHSGSCQRRPNSLVLRPSSCPPVWHQVLTSITKSPPWRGLQPGSCATYLQRDACL